MAGTRCANPDYQPDVDTMMVEYVLYKGVEANLQLLTFLSQTSDHEGYCETSKIVQHADSVLRLAEMYDALIRLHKHHHGDCLGSNIRRNGHILRFLTQLNSWAQNRIPSLQHAIPEASMSMREIQQYHFEHNHVLRRIWLTIYKQARFPQGFEAPPRSFRLCFPDYILPLFMYISVDLFRISQQAELSQEWMNLAASLMVQAAIEILDAPDLLAKGPDCARYVLEECCAWGYYGESYSEHEYTALLRNFRITTEGYHKSTSYKYHAHGEDLCQEMFREPSTKDRGQHSDAKAQPKELSAWTKVRQDASDDILMTFESMQEVDAENFHRPLALLRDKYQLTKLLENINDFLAIHWRLLHSKSCNGKPILIQIEEGGIDGLSAEEFEDFKSRARIQDMWDSVLLLDD